ncbi:hypothetical protein N8550_00405 [Pirellulaceae bacterium]|jgi:hypothetical protein|nr:hypothetical protein [Pirellulaceae bacterium]
MKAASLIDIKKSLARLEPGDLLETCLRLARFKKENKELLTYLLFMCDDEQGFADYLCGEIDEHFALTPNAHKKTLRKIIRWMDKCLRFTQVKETAAQVRIHFCRALDASETPYLRNKVTTNMFARQLKKVRAIVEKFHEDIQCEYLPEIEVLSQRLPQSII